MHAMQRHGLPEAASVSATDSDMEISDDESAHGVDCGRGTDWAAERALVAVPFASSS
jgi:hypothetical protein